MMAPMTPLPKSLDVVTFLRQRRGTLSVDVRMLNLSIQFYLCQEQLEAALYQGKPTQIRIAYERYVNRLLSEVAGLPSAWASLDLLLGQGVDDEPDLPTIVSFLYCCYPQHMTIPQQVIQHLIRHFDGMAVPSTFH